MAFCLTSPCKAQRKASSQPLWAVTSENRRHKSTTHKQKKSKLKKKNTQQLKECGRHLRYYTVLSTRWEIFFQLKSTAFLVCHHFVTNKRMEQQWSMVSTVLLNWDPRNFLLLTHVLYFCVRTHSYFNKQEACK